MNNLLIKKELDISVPIWTNEDLIRGCLRNDQCCQKALYERYCDIMYSKSYRITGDRHLASDALQEAFIQVFRDIGQLKEPASLGAWIKSIVVRSALKTVRKYKALKFEELKPSHTRIVWQVPMSGEALEKAILSLPPGYQVVFLLVEVEGYRHHEVAEMLDISIGTSKSQLFHAKKMLKDILKEH